MRRAMNRRRRGATLVLVVSIGAIVAILAVAMIELGYHARILAVRDVQRISARCAADAGMADAIFKMQKKLVDEATWVDANLPSATDVLLPSGARFSYRVTGTMGNYRIQSIGTCGQTSMAKRTNCQLRAGTYWEGIGVKQTVDIKLGTSFGVVGPGAPADMVIRSNSKEPDAMKFKAFVTVPGDIVCGPGGDPLVVIDTKATTIVLGEMYSGKAQEFPDVVPPAPPYDFAMGNWSAGLVIDQPGVYYFDSLTIPNGQKLQVNKDVTIYVKGKMILNESAEVIVNGGGELDLYLGTSLEDKNSTGFSNLNSNDARALRIFGLPTCTAIDLKAKSTLAAAVYAPDADLDLYNSGDFIGSITANSFDMKNSGRFLFDTRLMNSSIDDPAAVFVIGRWWED